MSRSVLLAAMATLMLSACATREPLIAVVDVEGPNGQIGGDVYAPLRDETTDFPRQTGEQIVIVRAFDQTKRLSDPERELTGALCLVRGDVFTAEVVTPGGVRLPLYGAETTAFAVRCEMPGYEPSLMLAKVYNSFEADEPLEEAPGPSPDEMLASFELDAVTAAKQLSDFRYRLSPIPMAPESDDDHKTRVALRGQSASVCPIYGRTTVSTFRLPTSAPTVLESSALKP